MSPSIPLEIEALNRANGNQAIAAEMLGITRQTLNWRLKQADLDG
jgi:DNA-binding protein Fis